MKLGLIDASSHLRPLGLPHYLPGQPWTAMAGRRPPGLLRMLDLATLDHEIVGKRYVRTTQATPRINRRSLRKRGRNLGSRTGGLVLVDMTGVANDTDRDVKYVGDLPHRPPFIADLDHPLS